MKKIKLLALCVLATFASCSWFDSKPIMPKIVGAAYLQYDSEEKAYYADIDSVKHYVENIAVSNYNHFFPQVIKPIDGMKVTIFETSESELRAAAGEKIVAEIEELYRANYAPLAFIFGSVFVLATIALIKIWPRKEKDHENSGSFLENCLDECAFFYQLRPTLITKINKVGFSLKKVLTFDLKYIK